MAKKGFIKDLNNIEMLPITRGELVLDSSGKLALHSNEFLATDSLPGLMSKEDKAKLDKLNENGATIDLVSATTDGLAPKIGTAAASTVTTQADEWVLTSTKGATPTWRKLPTNAFLNYYRPILVNGTSLLGNDNTALNIVAGTNINLTTDAGKVTINNGLTKLSLLTDDILSGKYLPLTGGTLTGNLTIGSKSNQNFNYLLLSRLNRGVRINNTDKNAYISFGTLTDDNGLTLEKLLTVGDSGLRYSPDNSNYYNVLHGLNTYIQNGIITINGISITPITSQSLNNYVTLNTEQEITGTKTFTKQLKFTVALGTAPFLVTSDTKVNNLNADLLDGYHRDDIIQYYGVGQNTSIDLNNLTSRTAIVVGYWAYDGSANVSNLPWDSSAANTWTLPGIYPLQIAKFYNSNDIRVRAYRSSGWTSWQQLAFTDSNITGNAATADKLKNKVQLWGNDFDGSNNVNGDISLGGKKIYWHVDPEHYYIGTSYTMSSQSTNLDYEAAAGHRFLSFNKELLRITTSGYVGVGTTDPKSKLDVNGSISNKDIINCYLDGTLNRLTIRMVDNTGMVYAFNESESGYKKLLIGRNDGTTITIAENGNVGIGTYYPLYKLDVNGVCRITDKLVLNSNVSIVYNDTSNKAVNVLQFTKNNVLHVGYNTNDYGYDTYIHGTNIYLNSGELRNTGIILNSLGNVTIGSSDLATDRYKLHVYGKVYLNEYNAVGNTSGPYLHINKSGNPFAIGTSSRRTDSISFGYASDNSWINEIITLSHTGDCVGINNNNPKYALDVNGTTYSQLFILPNKGSIVAKMSDNNDAQLMYFGSDNTLIIGTYFPENGISSVIAGRSLYLQTGTTRKTSMLINSSGNITIGNSDLAGSAYKLYVNGNTNINGSLTATTFLGNLDWSYITNKPTSFTPAAHSHNELIYNKDLRNESTIPNDYNQTFKFVGIKGVNAINLLESTATGYVSLIGWRGYTNDGTGPFSWEMASGSDRMYVRSGNTKTWTYNWRTLAYITDTYPTSQITALTGYTKATSASDLVTTDTLNTALGKLEYKAGIAYSWYRTITEDDTDEIINKWDEVVDFVNNLEVDLTDEFVTRKTNLTITGLKTFSKNIIIHDSTGADASITFIRGTIEPDTMYDFKVGVFKGLNDQYANFGIGLGNRLGEFNRFLYTETDGAYNVVNLISKVNVTAPSATINGRVLINVGEGLRIHADDNYFGTNEDARIISLLDGNGTYCDGGLIIDERTIYEGNEHITELLRIRHDEFKWKGATILHSGNSHIKNGVITINGNTITPLTLHLSLANYVTLNTELTITGLKLFDNLLIIRKDVGDTGASVVDLQHNLLLQVMRKSDTHSVAIGVMPTGSGVIMAKALSIGYNTLYLNPRSKGVAIGCGDKELPLLDDGYYFHIFGATLSDNSITATKFIKSGGTSSQFLKADGSVDSNTYLTSHLSLANYVTLNEALTISGIKTFSTLLKFIVSLGTSPFTVTSNTKVDNLNADFLDGYHVTSLVRKSEMANNSSFNANNMTTDLVIYTSKGDVGSNASVWDNFGASKPAGGFSLFHIKEGGYARQLLGVYNDRHLYTRSQYYSSGTVWSSWSTIALTSDIPKVTDYYWANVKISSTSSTTTTPTFGALTFTTPWGISFKGSKATNAMIRFLDNTVDSYGNGIVIGGGGVVIIGSGESTSAIINDTTLNITGGTETTYITSDGDIIFCSGVDTSTGRKSMVFGNGGNLTVPGTVTSNSGFNKIGSSNSYVLLGGGGHKAISDFLLKSEIANQELSNNLTTITKSLTVTADWMDTGIKYTDIPNHGTYIIQVSVTTNDSTGEMYHCYWSGVMTWVIHTTNDDDSDEILLHRSGHAYGNTIYLRTIMTTGTDGRHLRLLIAANKNLGAAYTYTFKFKRII